MSTHRRDWNPELAPEQLTRVLSGQYALNVRTGLKLAAEEFRYILSEITLYTDAAGQNVVPASAYGLVRDALYSPLEKRRSGQDATLWSLITITDNTYAGVDLYITCKNFGAYSSNDALVAMIEGNSALAENISIVDAGGFFTGTQVEAALQQLGASSKIEVINLDSTQTWTPGSSGKYIININTAVGSRTITLGNPSFIGQEIELRCQGPNLAYVKGIGSLSNRERSGIYSGANDTGTPISTNKKLSVFGATATRYQVTNEVTADYMATGGVTRVIQKAAGGMRLLAKATATRLSSSRLGFLWTFPIPFASAPIVSLSVDVDDGSISFPTTQLGITSPESISTTSTTLSQRRVPGVGDFGSGDTLEINGIAEGDF